MNAAARQRGIVERATDVTDPGLLAFQRRFFGDGSRQADPTIARWLFDANPGARDGPELWVSRRDGAIVGEQAGIPYTLRAGHADIAASWAIDLMVDPAWRLRGVGPGLSAAHTGVHRVVTAASVSDAAYRSYVRSGWTDLGPLPLYVRVLDVARALRVSTQPVALATLLRLVGPAAFGSVEASLRMLAAASRTSLERVERFDERSDAVWRTAAPAYRVIARRDAAWLDWRFNAVPGGEALDRAYLMRGAVPVGYVVTRTQEWNGVPVLVVSDYLARPAWILALIAHVLQQARARGAAAVVCRTLNARAHAALRVSGFLPLHSSTGDVIRAMVHVDVDDALAPLVRDRASWFVTAGDADLDADLLYRTAVAGAETG